LEVSIDREGLLEPPSDLEVYRAKQEAEERELEQIQVRLARLEIEQAAQPESAWALKRETLPFFYKNLRQCRKKMRLTVASISCNGSLCFLNFTLQKKSCKTGQQIFESLDRN
jgi:hypothetical protein